jgi:hypothetical protein
MSVAPAPHLTRRILLFVGIGLAVRVGGNIAGAIFTVGSMLIFLFGIPVLRYMFPVAVLFGCGIALAFRVIRHETPGKPWLRSAIEENTEVFRKPEREGHSGGSARVSSALHRAVDFRPERIRA